MQDFLRPADKKIIVCHYIWPVPVSLLSRESISPITPKAVWHNCVDHIQLWAVAVCKLPSQTKAATMPTNTRPVIIEKYCLVLWCWHFLQGNVENCWSVTRYYLKSYDLFVRATVLPMGYVGIYWRSQEKQHRALVRIMRRNSFLSASRVRLELSKRSRRTVKGRLVTARYHPRYIDLWPRLTPDHRCCRYMLADRSIKREPSALVSCAIFRSVHSQPLQL